MNKERTKRNRQQRACYFEFIDTIRAGEPPAAGYYKILHLKEI